MFFHSRLVQCGYIVCGALVKKLNFCVHTPSSIRRPVASVVYRRIRGKAASRIREYTRSRSGSLRRSALFVDSVDRVSEGDVVRPASAHPTKTSSARLQEAEDPFLLSSAAFLKQQASSPSSTVSDDGDVFNKRADEHALQPRARIFWRVRTTPIQTALSCRVTSAREIDFW